MNAGWSVSPHPELTHHSQKLQQDIYHDGAETGLGTSHPDATRKSREINHLLTFLITEETKNTKVIYFQFYLENSCAATIIYTPVPYLTITVTGADKIIFDGMKVQ